MQQWESCVWFPVSHKVSVCELHTCVYEFGGLQVEWGGVSGAGCPRGLWVNLIIQEWNASHSKDLLYSCLTRQTFSCGLCCSFMAACHLTCRGHTLILKNVQAHRTKWGLKAYFGHTWEPTEVQRWSIVAPGPRSETRQKQAEWRPASLPHHCSARIFHQHITHHPFYLLYTHALCHL